MTFDELMPVIVNNKSDPFLITVLLPLASITKFDELIEESKPIASVPLLKSVKVSESEDDVITMTSFPDPETIVSLPAPPFKVSSPSSP